MKGASVRGGAYSMNTPDNIKLTSNLFVSFGAIENLKFEKCEKIVLF